MQYIKPDVSTVCIGQAASMGSLLLAAGKEGKRFCLPHSRIMIHAREILNLKKKLNKIYEKHTQQNLNTIEKMMDRDHFMSSEESKKFGIVDKVVAERPKIENNIEKK